MGADRAPQMLGEGRKDGPKESLASVVKAGKYPYLWDEATGNWSVSKNVRNVFVMASGGPTSATVRRASTRATPLLAAVQHRCIMLSLAHPSTHPTDLAVKAMLSRRRGGRGGYDGLGPGSRTHICPQASPAAAVSFNMVGLRPTRKTTRPFDPYDWLTAPGWLTWVLTWHRYAFPRVFFSFFFMHDAFPAPPR